MLRLNTLAIALAVLGCSGALTGGVSPFERYTDVLMTTAALPVGGLRCEMFGGTRVGYCEATRTPAEVASLLAALPLMADSTTTFYGDSCASVAGFGIPNGQHRFDFLPGTTRHKPNGTLPPNTNNVQLRAIVVSASGTDVCFEYEFPYG